MTVLSVSGLALSFGAVSILENVTFGVNEGEHVGVIGVNGAGKTSLFRILTGEYTPDRGSVTLLRGRTIGMLAQNTDLSPLGEVSVLDYMIAGFPHLIEIENEIARLESELGKLDPAAAVSAGARLDALHRKYASEGGLEYRARCRSTLLRLGFSEEQIAAKVPTLSGGQHTRIALARLLAQEPDVLLLDEPTNHLDISALTWLEEFLSNYPKTVMVISHDRYFLDRTTTKTLLVDHKRATLYHGGYTQAKEQQAKDAESLEHRYREQQKEIARIRANIDFQRRCGQEHNFVTIRAKEKQLERMEKIERAPKAGRDVRMSFSSDGGIANDVLTVKDLSFSYTGTPLLTNLSFSVKRGERVLILGDNGCGKSTLLKLIRGGLVPKSGRITFGERVTYGFYDQENRDLCDSNTVFDELRAAYPQKTDGEIRSTLALFLFSGEDVFKSVASLSGGERARLTLAKLMLKPVGLLILDEPTNHLDIGSREALETAVAAFDGTVIAVSHDRYFIDRVATRIVEIDQAAVGGVTEYPVADAESAYKEYLRLREAGKQETETEPTPAPVSRQKEIFEANRRAAAEARSQAKKKERAEKRIPEIEKELADLETELYTTAAQNYVRASEIEERKAELEEELLGLYELTM
ncbi:MAG: ABC-F family ATP-binding cassette domain-containing protein [Clostridia bacterium]|nr:ABC-F family ATP-binding cassette domain-containing protein [Clostridia bacterium]